MVPNDPCRLFMPQNVRENGNLPARNPGPFNREHLIVILSPHSK
jgi:hypothetical protein